MSRLHITTFLVVITILFTSCQEEKVPSAFKPRNDHEAYQHSLKQADLLNTALGIDWVEKAQKSLESPINISPSYEEVVYADEKEATAIGYRFQAKRGQKVQVTVAKLSVESLKTFVDLFRIDSPGKFRHVASANIKELLLGFEPRRDADYVLRFQPELLRGGQFKITIENVPTLTFPVAGKTASAIGSFWGADRDGGKRKHEGVDIFAKRGTPIIAPVTGYIRFAGERGIGGKVVWLRDSKRSQSLYFAHMNEIMVEKGERVNIGDTLGTVGNTGNARTTPPHLHFGIYQNGATNPITHLKAQGSKLKIVSDDLEYLGELVRVNRASRMSINSNGKQSIRLNKNQIAKIIGINHNQYKVELPDGNIGYVNRNIITSLYLPIEILYAEQDGHLLKKPDMHSTYAFVDTDERLSILGRDKDFWLIQNTEGKLGWITDDFKNARQNFTSDTPK